MIRKRLWMALCVLVVLSTVFLCLPVPAFAAASLTLNPASPTMDTTSALVSGSGFAVNSAGFIWLDLNLDNIRDAGEPQTAVTTNGSGVIPSGIFLDSLALQPNVTYKVKADIPEGGSIEASKNWTTSTVTTSIVVTKYDAYNNIVSQETKTYQWLESNLPVQGDGLTNYYGEGPYFSPYGPGNTQWDINEEQTNLKDFGQPRGTDVKDLCSLVGGAAPGDTIRIKASDNFNKTFDYESVYNPLPALGKLVIAWDNIPFGGYVPGYDTGMRLLFFADPSTANADGNLVWGDWDMHETLPQSRWYYYSGTMPSSSGVSVQNAYYIDIFSPKLISCDASGKYKDTFNPGETVYVKGAGLAKNNGYKLWIQTEPVTFGLFDMQDIPIIGSSYFLDSVSDPSSIQESVTTDSAGDFPPAAIWIIDSGVEPQKYDIVADNQSSGTIGKFDSNDAIDNPGYAGFVVKSSEVGSQRWYLDNLLTGPVMEKIGQQSGGVTIAGGSSQVWLSDEKAMVDVTFSGTWTIKLVTTNWVTSCLAQVGEWDGNQFNAFNATTGSGSYADGFITLTVDAGGMVPVGHNLALQIMNEDSVDHQVITRGASYLKSPTNDPGYPLPEIAAGLLLGLGLIGMIACIIVRRKNMIWQANR